MSPYTSYDEVGMACAYLSGRTAPVGCVLSKTSSLTAPWYPAMRRDLLMGEGVQIKLWPYRLG